MTGLLTRKLGGKRPALLIALVAVTLAPFALAAGSYYSMNMLRRPVLGPGSVYILVCIIDKAGRACGCCWGSSSASAC